MVAILPGDAPRAKEPGQPPDLRRNWRVVLVLLWEGPTPLWAEAASPLACSALFLRSRASRNLRCASSSIGCVGAGVVRLLAHALIVACPVSGATAGRSPGESGSAPSAQPLESDRASVRSGGPDRRGEQRTCQPRYPRTPSRRMRCPWLTDPSTRSGCTSTRWATWLAGDCAVTSATGACGSSGSSRTLSPSSSRVLVLPGLRFERYYLGFFVLTGLRLRAAERVRQAPDPVLRPALPRGQLRLRRHRRSTPSSCICCRSSSTRRSAPAGSSRCWSAASSSGVLGLVFDTLAGATPPILDRQPEREESRHEQRQLRHGQREHPTPAGLHDDDQLRGGCGDRPVALRRLPPQDAALGLPGAGADPAAHRRRAHPHHARGARSHVRQARPDRVEPGQHPARRVAGRAGHACRTTSLRRPTPPRARSSSTSSARRRRSSTPPSTSARSPRRRSARCTGPRCTTGVRWPSRSSDPTSTDRCSADLGVARLMGRYAERRSRTRARDRARLDARRVRHDAARGARLLRRGLQHAAPGHEHGADRRRPHPDLRARPVRAAGAHPGVRHEASRSPTSTRCATPGSTSPPSASSALRAAMKMLRDRRLLPRRPAPGQPVRRPRHRGRDLPRRRDGRRAHDRPSAPTSACCCGPSSRETSRRWPGRSSR